MKNSTVLKHSLKSYTLIFLLGIFVGIIVRLTDLFPNDTLWSLSSIATLYGFWIFSIAIIVYYSCSNKNAGLNTFLYMFGMTLSFYGLQYILGLYCPKFDNGGFQTQLFLVYSVLSLICGIGGFILYFWNTRNKFSSILYALPIGALLAETLGVAIYLFINKVYLFQLLFNIVCVCTLGTLFYKKSTSKTLYCITAVIVTAGVYALIYMPFVNI